MFPCHAKWSTSNKTSKKYMSRLDPIVPHYIDVIMGAMASQINSLTVVYRLFGIRSKKTSKLRVTGLCAGNSPGPVNSPHKWRVTRKMFPFASDGLAVSGAGEAACTLMTKFKTGVQAANKKKTHRSPTLMPLSGGIYRWPMDSSRKWIVKSQ